MGACAYYVVSDASSYSVCSSVRSSSKNGTDNGEREAKNELMSSDDAMPKVLVGEAGSLLRASNCLVVFARRRGQRQKHRRPTFNTSERSGRKKRAVANRPEPGPNPPRICFVSRAGGSYYFASSVSLLALGIRIIRVSDRHSERWRGGPKHDRTFGQTHLPFDQSIPIAETIDANCYLLVG